MPEITYTPDAVLHSLSHFCKVDSATVHLLEESGIERADIDSRLVTLGSKFLPEFATSPRHAVEALLELFPEKFAHARADRDGRVRLSFRLDRPIGIANVISVEKLDRDERSTVREEMRGPFTVRSVRLCRRVETDECQLILQPDGDSMAFCTIFPGEPAPPLPRSGEKSEYWDTHVFIRNK